MADVTNRVITVVETKYNKTQQRNSQQAIKDLTKLQALSKKRGGSAISGAMILTKEEERRQKTQGLTQTALLATAYKYQDKIGSKIKENFNNSKKEVKNLKETTDFLKKIKIMRKERDRTGSKEFLINIRKGNDTSPVDILERVKGFKTKELAVGLKSTASALGGLGKSLLTGALAGAGIGAIVALVSSLPQILKSSINLASELTEQANSMAIAFKDSATSFGSMSKDAKGLMAFTKELSYTGGTFQGESMKYASQLGFQLGKGEGSAYLTKRLLEAGIDLGSISNISNQRSMQAISSGLAGESEPLRRLGINVMDKDMKEFYEQRTGREDWSELNNKAKTFYRAQAILFQMDESGRTGDFKRTSSDFANLMKTAGAQLKRFGAGLGKVLQLAITPVMVGFIALNNVAFKLSDGLSWLLKGMPDESEITDSGLVAQQKKIELANIREENRLRKESIASMMKENLLRYGDLAGKRRDRASSFRDSISSARDSLMSIGQNLFSRRQNLMDTIAKGGSDFKRNIGLEMLAGIGGLDLKATTSNVKTVEQELVEVNREIAMIEKALGVKIEEQTSQTVTLIEKLGELNLNLKKVTTKPAKAPILPGLIQ